MLKLSQVGRHYEQRWVLRRLDFSVQVGQFVAFLGESGGGKSTLLNLIAGLDDPDEGSIVFQGQDLQALNESQRTELRRTQIGFVFQAFHLLNHLKAWQNIALPLLLSGVPVLESQKRALIACEQLGLSARSDTLVPLLSGGEQQRVALARAIIHRPALVLADEPTGNLDPSNAAPALALLKKHCVENGATVLMVTHSAQAAATADRVLHLKQGMLIPATNESSPSS